MRKKLDPAMILLIQVLVTMCGLILIVLGLSLENNSNRKSFVDNVGVGLIATGGVNLLGKLLEQEDKPEMKPGYVRIVSTERRNVAVDIHAKKFSAKKIDIVGVNLEGCLKDITNDPNERMLKHLFSGHCSRLRLLLLHPGSRYMEQRALEDNISGAEMKRRQKNSVKLCVKFYSALKRYKENYNQGGNQSRNNSATVEIRLIYLAPHITVERYDNEIYWGLYTSEGLGYHSPMFMISQQENSDLFEQIKKNFNGLRTKKIHREKEENLLVHMVMDDGELNEGLLKGILEEDEVKEILKYA